MTKKKKKCNVTYTTGCPVLNMNFFNKDVVTSANSSTCTEPLSNACCGDSLTEEQMLASRLGVTVELPSHIHVLDESLIKAAIKAVEPEEEFDVGYVTPIYFYKDLWDKFSLIKCTELHGWTGEDYIEARASKDNSANRIALSKQQTAAADQATADEAALDHTKTDMGTHADRNPIYNGVADFSAKYTLVNKIVAQEKGETLLFYPEVGSLPRVSYYIDLKDGNGYQYVTRDDLENTIYKKVVQIGSKRSVDIRKKIDSMLTIDGKTIAGVPLRSQDRWDSRSRFDAAAYIEKPLVRALYLNQIYYLKTKGKALGKQDPLTESLTENKTKDLWDWLSEAYND